MATKTKAKAKVPSLTVAEIREKIGDTPNVLKIDVGATKNVLKGLTIAELAEKCNRIAVENGLTDFTLGIKPAGSKSVKKPGRRWDYDYVSWTDTLQVIGTRPYTDAELETGGAALVKKIDAAAKRAAKVRAEKLSKLNALNRELGLPEVTEA